MKKRIFSMTVCLLMSLPHLFAVSTFSGFAEMFYALRIDDGRRTLYYERPGDETSKSYLGSVSAPQDLALLVDGQFDIANFAFVRASLAALGTNAMRNSINGVSISGDYYAFSINEISLSLHFPVLSTMHYASLFVGNNFESPGTDSYLGKYFGTPPVSSFVIQNRLFHNGVPIYPTPGYGLAYHVKFPFPLIVSASGIFLSSTAENSFAFDLRAAGAYTNFNYDAFFGLGTVKSGVADLRFGVSGFFSNSDIWGIFLQAAEKLSVRKKPATSDKPETQGLKNLYLVVEPRFAIGPFKLDVTFFSLPADTDTYIYDNLAFISFANRINLYYKEKNGAGALGGGFTLHFDDLRIGHMKSKVALSVIAGLDNNFDSIVNNKTAYHSKDHFHLQITPFWSLTMKNGTLSVLATYDPLNKRGPSGQTGSSYIYDPVSSLGLRVGYIVNF